MLIKTIADNLLRAPALKPFVSAVGAKKDANLSVSQSARDIVVAALFQEDPRPLLYVASGNEAARTSARTLSAWLGEDAVFLYPEIDELPWAKKPASVTNIGKRCEALSKLYDEKPVCVVASARALLRRVPPVLYFKPLTFSIGDVIEPAHAAEKLQELGYTAPGALIGPGTFHLHGDLLDVYPSQMTHAVRLEFFGDEIDHIRDLLGASAQAIRERETLAVSPAREYALNDETIKRARRALWEASKTDGELARELDAIETATPSAQTELYLQELYGKTASPLDYIGAKTTVVLNEPRALIDDCIRATEELKAHAHRAGKRALSAFDKLFHTPQALDFGKRQQISLSSLKLAHAVPDATLATETPHVQGKTEKLTSLFHELCQQNFRIAFSTFERASREKYELTLSDAHVPFTEAAHKAETSEALRPGYVTFVDEPLDTSIIFPEAKLALFSEAQLFAKRTSHKAADTIDVTQITFPFNPGDYVVHAVHGVARFAGIVRQGRAGEEQDYFQLDYADKDKLFVPLAQLSRITRYIGVSDAPPKLTRLKSGDWAKIIGRARKNAKKLAFDLVDLYARRSSAQGIAYLPDTPEQCEMEAAFPYTLTTDQARAIEEVKADMQRPRPMDRLLSGDVGFGKTEVALRAAFKAVEAKKQVFVLCPTTILAQQHFETFQTRFAPFGIEVDVLSRFRTPSEQKRALQKLEAGTLDVLVGTHRLLSPDVQPKNLGLVIIDEEQRFGVGAKELLKNLRTQIDVLTLSATPIPRTLQMSLSGVRDMSLIMTPPKGRMPVKVQVEEYNLDTVSDAVRQELARSGQVYYISNRVASIDDAVARVSQAAPEARIGVAHGQMSASEIERVMYDFAAQHIDVLIATTIIESGIDNPHTNTLIIEDSERLGLAQLYQLKGRVGRGHTQAYAYFMFSPNKPLTKEAAERLVAIDEYQDLGSGIRIAMRDLELRGAGSIIGAEQHGQVAKVGFDLFMELLSEAVDQAKGELPQAPHTTPDPLINLKGQYFLSADLVEAVDERVLLYRRIAYAKTPEALSRIEQDINTRYGKLDTPATNLLLRQRLIQLAKTLHITHITEQANQLIIQATSDQLKDNKLTIPIANNASALETALQTLQTLAAER